MVFCLLAVPSGDAFLSVWVFLLSAWYSEKSGKQVNWEELLVYTQQIGKMDFWDEQG